MVAARKNISLSPISGEKAFLTLRCLSEARNAPRLSKVILTQKIAYASHEGGKLAFRPLSLNGLFRRATARASSARLLGALPPAPRWGAARSAGGNPSVFSPAGHRSLRSKLYCVIVYSLKIPKSALMQTSFACALPMAKKGCPRAPRCPRRGQRQGRKNSPRSQRRSSRRPKQRKKGKAKERSVPCPNEQRRQKGAKTGGRGEFSLVKLRKLFF